MRALTTTVVALLLACTVGVVVSLLVPALAPLQPAWLGGRILLLGVLLLLALPRSTQPPAARVRRFAALVTVVVPAARLIHALAVRRRAAGWCAVVLLALAFLLVLDPLLPPGTQFNLRMALFIVIFIIGASLIAALFTFLFLKSFESLDRSFLRAFLYFLPLTGASVYLVAGLLRDGLGARPGATWAAYALAVDLMLLATVLILAGARLLGRRFGPRNFVSLVAWKFLRSQREVPTVATRRRLRLRELHPEAGRRPAWWRTLLEVALVVGAVPLGWSVARWLVLSHTTLLLVRTGVLCAAAALLLARSLRAPGRYRLLYLVGAVAAGAWSVKELALTAGSAQALWPAWVAPAVAGAALLLLLVQYATRTVLRMLAARQRLPRNLDPRYAPDIVTRMREGVGGSVFAAVVGVAIGVWALIVVLSVMGGFSGEMEGRIVRTKDHIMVKTPAGSALPDALGTAARIRAIDGVAGAAAYVEADAMMSSSLNISSTVTVRGIGTAPDATEALEAVLAAGRLEFFRQPEELVPFPGITPYPDEIMPAPLEAMPEPGDAPQAEMESADDSALDEGTRPAPLPRELPGAPGLIAMPPVGGEPKSGADPVQAAARAAAPGRQVLPPLIIGQELARSLGVGIGSKVTVISPDGDVGPMGVQPKVRSFAVAAIFSTGMYEYDLKLAYMALPDAQRFFNLGTAIDHIDVRLDDLAAAKRLRPAVAALVEAPGAEVLTWEELNRNLFSALKLERVVMFIVLGFIILIASFNIVSSLVIIIRKRLAAIAILKTMGASARDVTGIFFLLGGAAGLFGAASGVIMGLSSCGIIQHLGITLPREYYIRSLPVLVDGWQVGQVAIAALIMTALASLYPGRLAARVLLVEGLKDER